MIILFTEILLQPTKNAFSNNLATFINLISVSLLDKYLMFLNGLVSIAEQIEMEDSNDKFS